MKRLLAAALAAGSLLCQVPTAQAVGTSASSAILMDAESGRVLYEQNAHEERLIASITKLMTALVALESGHDLEETVTVGEACTRAEGSSLYLRPGEEISLKGLLYGVMLRSGNDAALAVAEHCGGSVEEFVGRMNEKAAQLGMVNSHFANPNGLNAEGHYSSAYDMALLARATEPEYGPAIPVATASGLRVLPFADIEYLECTHHVVHFHLASGEDVPSLSVRVPFAQVAQPLLADERFVQLHRSYVVNLAAVSQLAASEFWMQSGARVPVPRGREPAARTALRDYLEKQFQ